MPVFNNYVKIVNGPFIAHLELFDDTIDGETDKAITRAQKTANLGDRGKVILYKLPANDNRRVLVTLPCPDNWHTPDYLSGGDKVCFRCRQPV